MQKKKKKKDIAFMNQCVENKNENKNGGFNGELR